jgi:hypothetical protein
LLNLISFTSYVYGQTESSSQFAEGAHWTYRAHRRSEITFKGDVAGESVEIEVIVGRTTVKELNATRLVIENTRGRNYSFYVAPMMSSPALSLFTTEIVRSTIDRSSLTYLSTAVNSDYISSQVGSPAEEFMSTSLRDNQSIRYWHDLIGSTLFFIATEKSISFHGKDVPVIALHYDGTVIRPIDVKSDYPEKWEGSSILDYTVNVVCTANFERTTGLLLSLELKEVGSYSDPLKRRESSLIEVAEYVVEFTSWEIQKITPIPNKTTPSTQASSTLTQTTPTPAATIHPTSAPQKDPSESYVLSAVLSVVFLIVSLPFLEALASYVKRRAHAVPPIRRICLLQTSVDTHDKPPTKSETNKLCRLI